MTIPDAVTIFLNQIGLEGGIPFEIRLPKANDMINNERSDYCYGIAIPHTYEGGKELKDFLFKHAAPQFKAKLEAWLKQAMEIANPYDDNEWAEDDFWYKVLFDNNGESDIAESFKKLFKDEGLHLILSMPIPNERNEVDCQLWPIVGFYLKGIDSRRAEKNERPRIHRILIERLRKIFNHIDDSELEVYDVFYPDIWELPYNPNDPNFMTKDDY